jgi:hypothetical protein
MAFVPGNPLEQVLLDASQGADPQELLAALAANPVFIPAASPGVAGELELRAGATVELPVFEHQGQRYVPVFTAQDRVGADGYLRLTGEDLAAIWPAGHALAINPGEELSLALPEADVRALNGGVEHIPAGSDITVGVPSEEPEALWDALRSWAAAQPAVRAAHRALVLVHAPGQEPQLVVGLELDAGADERLLSAGAQVLDGAAAFTRVDPAGNDPVSQWWLDQAAPIYVRS